MSTTRNIKMIKASPREVYRAFTDAKALEAWMAPGDMKARVVRFDLRVGGSYEMVLEYPEADQGGGSVSRAGEGVGADAGSGDGVVVGADAVAGAVGKSGDSEDRYVARFVVLEPGKRIVEAIRFDTADVRFQGEMTMEVDFEAVEGGTLVTMVFRDIPGGISPEDNDKGTELSLEKLAVLVEITVGN